MYKVSLSKQAQKDLIKLKQAGTVYSKKVKALVNIVSIDPFNNPPPYEKLIGDLHGYYSRRINNQHRFVYEVLPNTDALKNEDGETYKGIVRVLKMWTHYE
jgi:Txe/YoeB family toxin of toxin-antitoxin system